MQTGRNCVYIFPDKDRVSTMLKRSRRILENIYHLILLISLYYMLLLTCFCYFETFLFYLVLSLYIIVIIMCFYYYYHFDID